MKRTVCCLLFLALVCTQAVAATLDFNNFQKGTTEDDLNFPGVAVVESTHGVLFVYGDGDFGMPDTGGLCALQEEFSCTGGFSLLFIGPVSNLTFKGYFATAADGAIISAYSGDSLQGRQLVSGNGNGSIAIDFSDIKAITRIDVLSTPLTSDNGIAYGDFDFDIDPPGTVPPPPLPDEALSFDALLSGVNGPTIDIGTATATTKSGEDLFVYRSGDFAFPDNGGLCAVTTDYRCMGSFVLKFDAPIFDLMFSAFFAKATDSMIVSLFYKDQLVSSDQFWGNSGGTIRFDFRGLGLLDRILIEDRSSLRTKGAAYGDFRYRLFVPSPVPVPASILLLVFALALLVVGRLGRRARTVVERTA